MDGGTSVTTCTISSNARHVPVSISAWRCLSPVANTAILRCDRGKVHSAPWAELRRARYDRNCEVVAQERLTKCFEPGQVQAADQDTPTCWRPPSARPSFTTRHHAWLQQPTLQTKPLHCGVIDASVICWWR